MQEDTLEIQSAYGFQYSMEVAGLGARAYAFTIDWHIRFVAALCWVLVAMLIVFLLNVVQVDSPGYYWLLFLPSGLIYYFYHPVVELAMQGNTPGKRYAKVKVLTVDGGIPSATAILIRNVMRILDSLPIFYMVGFVTCMVTRQQVRIGDLAAGTLLVYEQAEGSVAMEAELQGETEGISIQQRELIQKLLDRWDELTPENREVLGEKALVKFGRSPQSRNIKSELQSLLG